MRARRSLRFAWLALAVLSGSPVGAQDAGELPARRVVVIDDYVAEAARRFGIPESWIYAVLRTESAGRIGAVSSAGAMGLMQLMPGTWARQRARFGLGNDPFDPRDNITAGASYLREMYDSYGAPGFLAAYNAGPGRYEDWRDRGRPLPTETTAYVTKIASSLQIGSVPIAISGAPPPQSVRVSWAQSQLFAVRQSANLAAPVPPGPIAPPAPFEARSAPSNDLFAPVSGSRSR